MKNKRNRIVGLGIVCVLLTVAAAWYTTVYNEGRLLAPMEASAYVFRMRDLPMLAAGVLLVLYVGYLVVLCVQKGRADQQKAAAMQHTRTVDPKWGFLGLLGFAGFLGFWTYSVDKTVFPFLFFVFFGFFGFFYEGKMSDLLMDERYTENRLKAQAKADNIALGLIFLEVLLLGQGRLMGSVEMTLATLVAAVSLSIALGLFLREYLLYRYDSDELLDEGEE